MIGFVVQGHILRLILPIWASEILEETDLSACFYWLFSSFLHLKTI